MKKASEIDGSLMNVVPTPVVPFDVEKFCKRHLAVQSREDRKELRCLIRMAADVFKSEPMLAKISPPCTVVGDIHGQFRDLLRILHGMKAAKSTKRDIIFRKFVFLGDFVDRGTHSTECISLVFSLKICLPKHFVLLRGNHEIKNINMGYGFREELMAKFGQHDGHELWETFNDAFSYMPVAALIGGTILCMHGGISPYMTSLADIENIKRPLVDVNENRVARDLLWSDPMDYSNPQFASPQVLYLRNTVRGVSVFFNEAAVKEFVTKMKLQMIVRAHQLMDEGFKFYADRKLVTIFSAPRYMQENENKAAVLNIPTNGQISISILRPSAYKEYSTERSSERSTGSKSKSKSLSDSLLKK